MESPVNITRNCTFNHVSNDDFLCQYDLITDRNIRTEHPSHIDKELGGKISDTLDGVDEFEKSMELVFEVGLLTICGVLGVIGNVAAIILFAR